MCVVVLGPYRSGTSVTSRVLHHLGVNFGPKDEMFEGDGFNPGGYYERADINRANTAFIQSAGFTLADPGEPTELSAKGDRKLLNSLNLSWRGESPIWGVKDPRMCATLCAWLDCGLLDPARTRLICIQRDAAQITRSVLEFPQVRDYCDGTPEGARAMVDRYLGLVEWNAAHCGLPVYQLQYERLIADTVGTTSELAAFLGVSDAKHIRAAAGEVGKRRSRFKLWAFEYPRRAWRRALRAVGSGGRR